MLYLNPYFMFHGLLFSFLYYEFFEMLVTFNVSFMSIIIQREVTCSQKQHEKCFEQSALKYNTSGFF
jgi:hypothetical protein